MSQKTVPQSTLYGHSTFGKEEYLWCDQDCKSERQN